MAATIILVKCGKNNKTYGIRVERYSNEWMSTWAFPIDEAKAKREGFDRNKITGTFRPTRDYPGCPFCGTSKLLQCECGRMLCYNDEMANASNSNNSYQGNEGKNTRKAEETSLKCPWCLTLIREIKIVETFNVKSGGF